MKFAILGWTIGTFLVVFYALLMPWLSKFFIWYWAWVAAL